jgi:hypothetical protein
MRALLLSLLLALPARAETEVDLELVLAVDISRSMSAADLAIQRRGYAEALLSAEVLSAIRAGFLGRIAVTYVEWSGADRQRVLADWTLISSEADAAALAARISAETGGSLRRTSISEGLLFAARRFDSSPFRAPRRVIDISGDGPNNEGPPVTAARDAVLARGITVNGLPLMSGLAADPLWHIDNLDLYYRDCVIGGPGAFVVPVRGWDAFADAVRRKLVLEISGLAAAGLRPAQAATAAAYDCLIGERVNERRRRRD